MPTLEQQIQAYLNFCNSGDSFEFNLSLKNSAHQLIRISNAGGFIEIFKQNDSIYPAAPEWTTPRIHVVAKQPLGGGTIYDLRQLRLLVEMAESVAEYWLKHP